MKYRKDGKEIEASPKAFRLIYAAQGYVPVDTKAEPDGAETEKPEKPRELDEMTVPELKALAKEKGLEGTSGLNKEELLSVLKDVV